MAGAGPGRVVRRTLTVDNTPINQPTDIPGWDNVVGQLTTLNVPRGLAEQVVVETVAASPDIVATNGTLAAFIARVATALRTGTTDDQDIEEIAERLGRVDIASHLNVEGRGNSPYTMLSGINLGQASALSTFLEIHPQFVAVVRQAKTGFKLGDKNFEKAGGMFMNDKTVHVRSMKGFTPDSPQVFMRLLLHEIGHAIFQRMLFKDPQVKLAQSASKDAAAQDLQDTFDRRTDPLTADGKDLYGAWMVLRANGGYHMFAVDIADIGNVASRQAYQAATFEEFCAESFMHLALEQTALRQHIQNIASGTAPQNVKAAWATVERILLKYKDLILELPPPPTQPTLPPPQPPSVQGPPPQPQGPPPQQGGPPQGGGLPDRSRRHAVNLGKTTDRRKFAVKPSNYT